MYSRLMKLTMIMSIIFSSQAAQSDHRRKKPSGPIDATYKRAVQYRDGTGSIPQDSSKTQEIDVSVKDRFLAICDFHEYPLPMKRKSFEFDYQLIKFNNDGHKEIEGAIYAQEFNNTGYLSAPIIWVENPEKFLSVGTIRTKLLIVGTKRIMDDKS